MSLPSFVNLTAIDAQYIKDGRDDWPMHFGVLATLRQVVGMSWKSHVQPDRCKDLPLAITFVRDYISRNGSSSCSLLGLHGLRWASRQWSCMPSRARVACLHQVRNDITMLLCSTAPFAQGASSTLTVLRPVLAREPMNHTLARMFIAVMQAQRGVSARVG